MYGPEKEERWEAMNNIVVNEKFGGLLNLDTFKDKAGDLKKELVLGIHSGKYGLILKKEQQPVERIPERGDTDEFAKIYYKLEDDFVKKDVLNPPEIGDDVPTVRYFFWKNTENPPNLEDFVAALRKSGIEIEKK